MPELIEVLKALEKRNLKLNLSQDNVELVEISMKDKNIDIDIKNRRGFKELLKELKKWKN